MKRHHKFKDLTSQKFGSLTAIKYLGSDGGKSTWLCQCECGNTCMQLSSELSRSKGHKSCGCKKWETLSEKATTHGMSEHPAYWVWRSMRDRCRLPTHQAWENYGGRGIKVCERWEEDFQNFWDDMGSTYQSGLDIDRINNDGHYQQDNCRWATRKTNCNKPQKLSDYRNPVGSDDSSRSCRTFRDWGNDIALPNNQQLPSEEAVRQTGLHQQVYDIANCGPRHRFVVRAPGHDPFIAHNCIQALAFIVLKGAMVRTQRRYEASEHYAQIGLNVHDELVAAADEAYAEEAAQIMKEELIKIPDWADDTLCLDCSGGISRRYNIK